MKNETYKIELPGSQPYAKLVTYIQDDSAEIGIASGVHMGAEPQCGLGNR